MGPIWLVGGVKEEAWVFLVHHHLQSHHHSVCGPVLARPPSLAHWTPVGGNIGRFLTCSLTVVVSSWINPNLRFPQNRA